MKSSNNYSNNFNNNKNSKITDNKKNLNLSIDYINKGKINIAGTNNFNNNNSNHYPNIHLFNNKNQETKINDYKNIEMFLDTKDN